MAARLGAEVTMISAIGDDDNGRRAVENLRTQGVATDRIRVVPGPTGTAAILVDDRAENVIVVVPGANGSVSPEQVREAAATIGSAKIVVAQLETRITAAIEAFRLARAAGARTLLNPAPALAVPDELLKLTDLIVPNESELETLTGMPARSEDELTAATVALSERGPATVLVTLGDRGAFVLHEDETFRISSVRVDAVDPTAAGDAFVGALAVFLSSGESIVRSAQKACAVAALTVTRPGAQSSFPTRVEIESALRRYLK
jgi:ribokinase